VIEHHCKSAAMRRVRVLLTQTIGMRRRIDDDSRGDCDAERGDPESHLEDQRHRGLKIDQMM